MHILFSWSIHIGNQSTMKQYYPELQNVTEVLDRIPHPKIEAISDAIRICNDQEAEMITKVIVVTRAILI